MYITTHIVFNSFLLPVILYTNHFYTDVSPSHLSFTPFIEQILAEGLIGAKLCVKGCFNAMESMYCENIVYETKLKNNILYKCWNNQHCVTTFKKSRIVLQISFVNKNCSVGRNSATSF